MLTWMPMIEYNIGVCTLNRQLECAVHLFDLSPSLEHKTSALYVQKKGIGITCLTPSNSKSTEYQFSGLSGSNPCRRAYSSNSFLQLATNFQWPRGLTSFFVVGGGGNSVKSFENCHHTTHHQTPNEGRCPLGPRGVNYTLSRVRFPTTRE